MRLWLQSISARLSLATAYIFCIAMPAMATGPAPAWFNDVAAEVGLHFAHNNFATPQRHFPETAEGGGAFLDFDGDSRLDIYLVQGAPIVSKADPAATMDGQSSATEGRITAARNALFRQAPDGHFEEVAGSMGVDHAGVGMGCCAADLDNDGDLDLYVTNYGPNVLYRNDGNHFTAMAPEVSGAQWSAGCAFGDYDRDGFVDLYVANYVEYDPDHPVEEATPYVADVSEYKGMATGYPHPAYYPGQPDYLYRNQGDGSFADVTATAGLYQSGGKGLGVAFADYDADGWPDIYVANDNVRNYLFHNEGEGQFDEVGIASGASYGQTGRAEAGMGVDWGDYDNDGRQDLVVTNFQREPNTLLHNEGDGFFRDESYATGSGKVSLPLLGFGTNFLDFDLDGRLDLFVANGHVLDNAEQIDQSTTYRQPDLLLHNQGPGEYGATTFVDVASDAGPGFSRPEVGRGSAIGDYDADGDPDILVIHLGAEPALLRNDSPTGNWLRVRTIGATSNSDGVGTRIELFSEAGQQVREIRAGSSYQSQSELPVHFGLGSTTKIRELVVYWPSGAVDTLHGILPNQTLALEEGSNQEPAQPPPAGHKGNGR